MSTNSSPDFPEYAHTAGVWNRIAAWWDDRIGNGNDFQDILIEPTTERLLEIQPGDEVLDIACGAGRFARRMAACGTRVCAFDYAEKFIERARKRTTVNRDRIEYHVLDATSPDALLSLGKKRFDAAVCTMALMDMSSIEPLISCLPQMLKQNGRFVFSVLHPVFNSGTCRRIAEESFQDGRLVTKVGVVVTDYLQPFAHRGIGVPGQPELQYYFHRPLSVISNTCFKHGCVLDRIEEPAFPESPEDASGSISWHNMPSIPPVLVARMLLK
ncbi:MAG: class I SAM-dependent methyltransferase [Chloroflexota bacterium]